jgi:aryl-alcohol dehydrogenase-like predicted oxidoreductase
MEYRFLGKTGLKVSEIAFGPGNNNVVDDAEGTRLINTAYDLGVTIYETGGFEKNGKIEEWLGKVFRGQRDAVVIATKFSGDATRKHIITECEKSLKRLDTDYIDLYQFHHWQPTVAIEDSLEALTSLVQQGKILYSGCCWFKTYQIANALRAAERYGFTKLVSVGPQYNLLGQDVYEPYVLGEVIDFDLIPFCAEERLGVIAFRALAGGLLTGKYRPGEAPPEGSRFTGSRYGRPDFVEKVRPLLEVVERMRPLAERRGETLAQFSIAWVLSKPVVSSVLIGANTVAQLTECVGAAGHRLSAEELRAVDEIRSVLPGCITVPSIIEQRWIERGYERSSAG